MAVTETYKMKAVHHLGYAPVEGNSYIIDTIKSAIEDLATEVETMFTTLIDRLDDVQTRADSAEGRLAVTAVDEIRISPNEMSQLRKRYRALGEELGEMLGVRPNLQSSRYRSLNTFNVLP